MAETDNKSCTKCGESKAVDEFYRQNGRPAAECKSCYRLRASKYYHANKEKVLKREAARRSQVDWSAKCKKYACENWAMKLMHSAILCSKRRGHPDPTIDEAWVLEQLLVCPYLNVAIAPSLICRDPWAPSLDRIDNSKGYSPDNVRVTSWIWNLMRGALTVDEALSAVAAIRSALPLGTKKAA